MVNGHVFMGHKPHQLQGQAPSVNKIHLCPGRGSISVAWVDQFDWVLSFTSHHSETGFCGTFMLSQHMRCIAVFFFLTMWGPQTIKLIYFTMLYDPCQIL